MTIDGLLLSSSKELVNWVRLNALPLWAKNGLDEKTGAAVDFLSTTGLKDRNSSLTVRIQAQHIYLFSKAHTLDWKKNAKATVYQLVGFSNRYCKHPSNNGYSHRLNPNYTVQNKKQDLYDHAFWLLACASRYQAFGEPEALMEANAIIELLDTELSSVKGGWFEGNYMSAIRRQNSHMYMFEAFLNLYEATSAEKWLKRAQDLYQVFQRYFFDYKHHIVREFFNEHLQPIDDVLWNAIQPGHMMKWVWLLRWYEKLSGDNMDYYANALYYKGTEIGLSDLGLVYDEVYANGEVRRATKHSWPLMELIKASLAQARLGHPKNTEALAGKSLRALLDNYLYSPVKGLYVDQLDENDITIVNRIPSSTLYHLVNAAAEADKYCQEKASMRIRHTIRAAV